MTNEPELIHHRRDYMYARIACGVTGPVRVTRVFNDVTCTECVDAEELRRIEENGSDEDGWEE